MIASLLLLAPLTAPIQDTAPDRAEAETSKAAQDEAPDLETVMARAVELLLACQENYERDRGAPRMDDDQVPAWQERQRERLAKVYDPEGGAEWPYEGVYRTGGVIPGGYRVGGTALVCLALLDAPGHEKDAPRAQAISRSVSWMLDFLDEDGSMEAGPKSGYDVRGWGHAYALQLFLRLTETGRVSKSEVKRVREAIPDLLHCIAANENPTGGWNYANNRSASPFMTASTLIALYDAKRLGHEFDEGMIERALDALENGRDPKSGSFTYSIRDGRNRKEPMPASCARSSAAELVLFQAGRSDSDRLVQAVDGFFAGYTHLLDRKSQQGTHLPPYSIAPYYFFYGHTYAAFAIEALPDGDRAKYRELMREHLWRTLEEDGGWNDRIFPRSKAYSTAMAVMALNAAAVPPVAEYKAAKGAGDAGEGDEKF